MARPVYNSRLLARMSRAQFAASSASDRQRAVLRSASSGGQKKTVGAGSWAQAGGHRQAGTGTWGPTRGHKQVGAGRWAQAGGHRHVGTGRWAQARGHRQVGTGNWAQADGHRQVGTGGWAQSRSTQSPGVRIFLNANVVGGGWVGEVLLPRSSRPRSGTLRLGLDISSYKLFPPGQFWAHFPDQFQVGTSSEPDRNRVSRGHRQVGTGTWAQATG